MIKEIIKYQFSPLTLFVGWLFFIAFSIIEIALLISLWKDEAYIALCFLGLIVLVMSFEAVPKLFRFSKFLMKNEPALILSESQLVDNINNLIYDWSDIKKINYQLNYPANHISIEVKSPSKFIKKEVNFYNRFIMKLNIKHFNGTFSLKPLLIKGKKNDIVNSLNLFLLKSNTHNTP